MSRMVWSSVDVAESLAQHRVQASGDGAKRQLSIKSFLRGSGEQPASGGSGRKAMTTSTMTTRPASAEGPTDRVAAALADAVELEGRSEPMLLAVAPSSSSAASGSAAKGVGGVVNPRSALVELLLRHRAQQAAAPAAPVAAAAAGGRVGPPSALGAGAAPADDVAMWGPSGGGNRETQSRRGPRRFMNGRERQAVFDSSPYSRSFITAWREELLHDGSSAPSIKSETSTQATLRNAAVVASPLPPAAAAENTSFASAALLQSFVCERCPTDLFSGCVFFLNSCDSDPQISVYILEKLIRHLGGVTCMSITSQTTFVVAQHLCSAKEMKLVAAKISKGGAGRGGGVRYVHPRFVVECARHGRLLPWQRFSTMDGLLTTAPAAAVERCTLPVGPAPVRAERAHAQLQQHIVISDDDDDAGGGGKASPGLPKARKRHERI